MKPKTPKESCKAERDAVRLLGMRLSDGWIKYRDAFTEQPHGTVKQMCALVELSGGAKTIAACAKAALAGMKGRKK